MYKIVVRDKNGKVLQIHEVYGSNVAGKVSELLTHEEGHSLTITKLR